MGDLKNYFHIVLFPGYLYLSKIIIVNLSLSYLLSCSISTATGDHQVQLDSSDVLFQRMNTSLRKDFSSNGTGGGGAVLDESFKMATHVKRDIRSSENSSEMDNEKNIDDKGANLQEMAAANFNNGPHTDELKRKHLYLVLAQEEAKCLHEFGELEPVVSFEFPQDFFRPFVCVQGSKNFNACEQCIKITRTRGVHDGDTNSQASSCENICRTSSALPHCAERCKEVGQSLTNETQKIRYDAATGDGELNVKDGCNQHECKLKSATSAVYRRVDATSGSHNYSNITLTTNVFCESVTQPAFKAKSATKSTREKSLKHHKRDMHYRHFVYLKSLFETGGEGTAARRDVPVVFVIEQRELVFTATGRTRNGRGNWTSWRVLGKSPYGFDKVKVAYRTKSYQWRVTAVGIHGPIAVSVVKSFESLDGYVEPGPPRRVFVIENKPKESRVDVLLGWEPPQERACFYKIVLETRNGEEPARTMRIKGEPVGVHKLWFRDLKFDSTYEVRITSRSAEWDEDESTHTSLSFTTPACLDAHQFRFDKCAPPPPRNLSFSLKPAGSSKVMDANSLKRHFTAQLAWKPPAYANGTNNIEKYIVDIGAFSWNVPRIRNDKSKDQQSSSELIDPQYLLTPRQLHLPGNVTHLLLDNLDGTAEYTVLVSAVSSKGSSPAATLTIKLESEVGSRKATVSFWVYPWGILLTVLVIASGVHAVRRISRRRQIKAARDSYFRSIDQRDAFTVDWPMASLTEDTNGTWELLQEKSFPKDKWHVDFQDLTIGDVIGKGEFGVVRQALIKRDKYFELVKRRHNGKTLDNKCQLSIANVGDNETLMETVALKMLRVAATEADREDLRRELMTMQGLGVHPQIVTLLGVCTTPKSMHLVLEYCPGGDLLSFLRKFRGKYLPMLNLRNGKRKGIWCENPEYKRSLHEDQLMKRKLSESGDQLSRVCYTELHHNESSSSSAEFSDEIQRVTNRATETETCFCSNLDAACKSIKEEDVLAYARQIALGMAYLERNHIIHRDLACRNILVMEDHKRIKISDFGLSRDIYTRNVYRQKTEGKVPFKWMALESITSRIFTSKSDVWSFGIVLWELVTLGAVPYPAVENQELVKLLRTGYRMERPDNCSEELYALMRKCWRPVQVDRPNFTELISYLETMMEMEPELYLTLQP